ncbi:MAG: hypothetical protein WAW69_03375 [Polaromonas sp.]
MTKDLDNIEQMALRVRGTIPANHPLTKMCFDMPPSRAFREMLNLTEEAIVARAGFARLLLDHPLGYKLSSLSPNEALTYLLGLTNLWQPSNPPTGGFVTPTSATQSMPLTVDATEPTAVVTQMVRPEPVVQATNATETSIKADDAPELDDDDLYLYSTVQPKAIQ